MIAASAIAYATLRPMPTTNGDALPILCFACGELGGLDVVLNVILFLPLGAALVLAGWSVRQAAIACFLVSFTVEALQYEVIAGRDTSLSDLTTNSVGGWLGAWLLLHWRDWLTPTARTARLLAWGSSISAVAILAFTVAALRPTVPDGPYYGQYAPLRGTRVQFDGVVHAFVVGGVDIPYSIVDSADALRDSLRAGETWARANITTRSFPPLRADIVRVGSRPEGIIALSQVQHDMLYRSRLRATDWRLRVPTVMMRDAFPLRSAQYRIGGSLGARGWHMESHSPAGTRMYDVPFSALLAWSFFLPFEFPLDERRPFFNALWGGALLVPAGFYTAWATRGTRDRRRRWVRVATWATLPAALILAVAVVVPYAAGFVPTTAVEIGGATMGLALGIALAAVARWVAHILEPAHADAVAPNDEQGAPRREAVAGGRA